MQNRRKDISDVTPESEDAGLFRMPTRELVVLLTPKVRQNGRKDCIVDGFAIDQRNEMVEVELLFAGRRAREVAPMLEQIKLFALETTKKAAKTGRSAPPPEKIQMPMQARGSWRNRFTESPDGLHEKYPQFVIAQWALLEPGKGGRLFGEPPCHELRKDRTPGMTL